MVEKDRLWNQFKLGFLIKKIFINLVFITKVTWGKSSIMVKKTFSEMRPLYLILNSTAY